MKKVLILIYALSLASVVLGQQDPQFSNNMLNNIVQNPAFVGVTGKWNASGAQREQWTGIDGSPAVSVFSLDIPFNVLTTRHGFGVLFMSDKYGSSLKTKTTTVSLSYAYKFNFLKGQCSIGARINYINQSFDGNLFIPTGSVWNSHKQIISDNFDGPSVKSSEVVFDYSAGVFYHNSKFYLGASVNHVLEPSTYSTSFKNAEGGSETVDMKMKRHYYFATGYTFEIGQNMKAKPSIYGVSDFSSYQFTGNLNFLIKDRYWVGASYRQDDAIVVLAGITLNKGIMIGYAYDYGISKISKMSNGSHELMVSYSFDIKFRNQKYRSVRFL